VRSGIATTVATRRSCGFSGDWLLVVTGGGPTDDEPGLSMAAPGDPAVVDHSVTIRVPDCREAYEALLERGAEFLTPPREQGREIRCFFRDRDGHLFDTSEYGCGQGAARSLSGEPAELDGRAAGATSLVRWRPELA
jgi:hypothetical protein